MGTFKDKTGADIEIRSIRPDDEMRLLDFYGSLSSKTIYSFFEYHRRLSDIATKENLHKECNVDDKDLRLVAVHNDKIVAFGALLRLVTKEERYEIAHLVTDDYQGRGIGAMVMDCLIKHAVEFFSGSLVVAYTATSNYRVHEFLRKFKFSPEKSQHDQIVWNYRVE